MRASGTDDVGGRRRLRRRARAHRAAGYVGHDPRFHATRSERSPRPWLPHRKQHAAPGNDAVVDALSVGSGISVLGGDQYELSLAPGIISFLLGWTRLPRTGHVIRRIHLVATLPSAPPSGVFSIASSPAGGERLIGAID